MKHKYVVPFALHFSFFLPLEGGLKSNLLHRVPDDQSFIYLYNQM